MKQTKPVFKTPDDCLAYAEKVNPKRESLTIEKLRTFSGCEHYSDEKATEIIKSLELLAVIVCEGSGKESICIDNQYVVNLDNQQEMEVIPINFNQTKTHAA
jgi:hypothetical protein